MAKIVLWGSTPQSPTAQRLLQEAQRLGHQAHYAHPLAGPKLPLTPACLINRYTALNYDDCDLATALEWQKNHPERLVTNDPNVVYRLRDKYLQYLTLQEKNLPVIETHLLKNMPALEEGPLDHLSAETQDYVVKPLRSNGGRGLMLIKGLESLYSIQQAFHDLKDERFVVQPRVKKIREFRLFAYGLQDSKKFLWIERIPLHAGEYRGNRSYSHERLLAPKDHLPKMLEIQEKCQRAFPTLLYWGADVVLYEDKNAQQVWALFELNTSPGIIGPEALSGENIAAELITLSVGSL